MSKTLTETYRLNNEGMEGNVVVVVVNKSGISFRTNEPIDDTYIKLMSTITRCQPIQLKYLGEQLIEISKKIAKNPDFYKDYHFNMEG